MYGPDANSCTCFQRQAILDIVVSVAEVVALLPTGGKVTPIYATYTVFGGWNYSCLVALQQDLLRRCRDA